MYGQAHNSALFFFLHTAHTPITHFRYPL
jgi:hypothetical protein